MKRRGKGARTQVRQAEVLLSTQEGKSAKKIAAELGVQTAVVWRDLRSLRERYAQSNSAEFAGMQDQLLSELEVMEKALLEGMDPQVHHQWLGIQKERAKIRGLYAESRSVVAHVRAGQSSPLFLQFKKYTAGLTDDQMQEVFDFMAKLQRAPVVTVKDASWFPQPERKQLDEAETEGTDEEPV